MKFLLKIWPKNILTRFDANHRQRILTNSRSFSISIQKRSWMTLQPIALCICIRLVGVCVRQGRCHELLTWGRGGWTQLHSNHLPRKSDFSSFLCHFILETLENIKLCCVFRKFSVKIPFLGGRSLQDFVLRETLPPPSPSPRRRLRYSEKYLPSFSSCSFKYIPISEPFQLYPRSL